MQARGVIDPISSKIVEVETILFVKSNTLMLTLKFLKEKKTVLTTQTVMTIIVIVTG